MKTKIRATLRNAVLDRDNYRCRACGLSDVDHLECDHITPESRGGETSLDNLQCLCHACNNAKQTTHIGELPIRERIEGFGDYGQVMQDRQNFKEMLIQVRYEELEDLAKEVKQLKKRYKRTYALWAMLAKREGERKVASLKKHMSLAD